jgi:hypothetical protein
MCFAFSFKFRLFLTDFDGRPHFEKLRQNAIKISLMKLTIFEDDGRIQDG